MKGKAYVAVTGRVAIAGEGIAYLKAKDSEIYIEDGSLILRILSSGKLKIRGNVRKNLNLRIFALGDVDSFLTIEGFATVEFLSFQRVKITPGMKVLGSGIGNHSTRILAVELFYLLAKGIPHREAEKLLMLTFLAGDSEAIEFFTCGTQPNAKKPISQK